MDNDLIIQNIETYIKSEHCNYAIMLDGEWGSGKTYFINKEVIPKIKALNDDLVTVYVSLFGVNTIEEIKQKIFFEIANISTKTSENVFKGFASAINGVTQKFTGINLNLGSELAYNFLHNGLTKNEILIFDDIERTNIDICELLGFINEFIEHKKMKVILVANEKEINISKNYKNNELKYLVAINEKFTTLANIEPYNYYQEILNGGNKKKTEEEQLKINLEKVNKTTDLVFGNDKLYNQMKEKVIGKTIKYRPKLKNIIVQLINEINEINEESNLFSYKKILEDNIDFVVNELEKENHENIRSFKLILENFDLYLKSIDNALVFEDDDDLKYLYVTEVYLSIVCSTISYKKNGMSEKEKNEKYSHFYINRKSHASNSSYKKFISVEQIVTESLVANKDTLISDYDDFKKAYGEKGYLQDNWGAVDIFNSYWMKDDDHIESIIKDIYDKYINEKFSFLSALYSLKYLCDFKFRMGFKVDYIDEFIETIKDDINNSMFNRKVISSSYYPHSLISDYFVSYEYEKEFRNYITDFNEIIKKRNYVLETKMRNENYNYKNYGLQFRDDLNKMVQTMDVHIISSTDFNTFEEFIIDGNNESLNNFKWAIASVFDNYRYSLKNDLDSNIKNLEKLKIVLLNAKNRTQEKLKSSILIGFIDNLQKYIDELQEMKSTEEKSDNITPTTT